MALAAAKVSENSELTSVMGPVGAMLVPKALSVARGVLNVSGSLR